jgi:acyl carrier protein
MTAQREALRDQLIGFLESIARPGKQVAAIGRGESLVKAGFIDSLAILQIVLHLETTYGINFAATGLDPEQLGTLDGILDIIENHRK